MLTVKDIARVCYEANRGYCISMGDRSFGPWEDAPAWQQSTNIKGVQFLIENPNADPRDSHESWMKEKVAEGWVYGTVKDPVAKTHPCLLDYSELPAAQQAKDYIFQAIVRTLHDIGREQS